MAKRKKSRPPTYYHRYILREDEHPGGLLDFQAPYGRGRQSHPDEVLFIITHQTFELWFKEIIEEILRPKSGAVARINAGDFFAAAATVRRITKITRVLADQYGIIETITPSDFLRFRDVLLPSSGYDSAQFRALELASGLRGDGGYLRHLTGRLPEPPSRLGALASEIESMKAGGVDPSQAYSLVQKLAKAGDRNGLKLIARALSSDSLRDAAYRAEQEAALKEGSSWDAAGDATTAAEIERRVVAIYQGATNGSDAQNRPLFELLEALVEYDEVFRNLRAIHINMVLRVIGGKPGTGGSTGARYLRTTLGYSFFPLLWRARDHMEGPAGP